MTRPIRVGLVGAGFVARIHADSYRRLGPTAVVLHAVCEPPERSAAFAHEFGVAHAVADFDAILNDPEIDLVDLCVPKHLHAPFAVRAAEAGKHVAVEKPLMGAFEHVGDFRLLLHEALANAGAVVQAVQRPGVQLCYAENWVYAPPIQKARRPLAQAGAPILPSRARSRTPARTPATRDTGRPPGVAPCSVRAVIRSGLRCISSAPNASCATGARFGRAPWWRRSRA